MRLLLPMLASFLAVAGCFGATSQPFVVDPCDAATDPSTLRAQDELVLAPDRDYRLRLAPNGWGRLVLDLCEPMAVSLEVTATGPLTQPRDHSFVYFFREGDVPNAHAAIHANWGLPNFPSMCQLQGPPRPALRSALPLLLGALGEELEGRFVLIAAMARHEGEIRIVTGEPAHEIVAAWKLGQHPEHLVIIPTATPVSTVDAQVPPRTRRLDWRADFDPAGPSLVHIAGWHDRNFGHAAAGAYTDVASVDAGRASPPSFRTEGTHACAPYNPGGYRFEWSLENPGAAKVTLTRRYEESSAEIQAVRLGVALLNIPLDPVAAPPSAPQNPR